MAQLNADMTQYDVQDAFEVLPPGWYNAEVSDSEIKKSKSGNMYINWTFAIMGKPNKVWMTTVIGNDVAMRILKTMAACCGHRNPNYIADTEELHGKRCQVRLKIKTDENGDYDPKNEISGFKPLEQPKPATYQPQQQTYTPPPVQQQAAVDPQKGLFSSPAATPPTTSPPPAASNPKMPWE